MAIPHFKDPKKSKYNNKRVQLGRHGMTFDSKREAERFAELELRQKAGKISGLQVHPKFPLHVGTHCIGSIVPDFAYSENGEQVVEDVKGMILPLFKWKSAHFTAEYGLKIRIVK